MRPVRVTQTGTGRSSVVPLDRYQNPFNVGLLCVATGTIDYTVQYTSDDVFSPTFVPASANWFSHPSLTGKTASAEGNIAFGVTAVCVLVNSGSGSVTLNVVQSGNP